MDILTQNIQLTKQLLPKGRAFRGPESGALDTLIAALSISEQVAYRDALSTLDSLLPDNANFSIDDATDWERRLGLPNGSASPLATRMLAIARKLQHPGNIPARQHYLYVEGQLQAAGFTVYVYENRFPDGMGGYVTDTPQNLAGGSGVNALQHGEAQHGDSQHGGAWGNMVVNSLDENTDASFNVGNNLRSTFFIGGATIGSYAFVPIARKQEFRQLILKLKPAQTVAFLFVTYI